MTFFLTTSLEKILGISHLLPALPHHLQVNSPFLSLPEKLSVSSYIKIIIISFVLYLFVFIFLGSQIKRNLAKI